MISWGFCLYFQISFAEECIGLAWMVLKYFKSVIKWESILFVI